MQAAPLQHCRNPSRLPVAHLACRLVHRSDRCRRISAKSAGEPRSSGSTGGSGGGAGGSGWSAEGSSNKRHALQQRLADAQQQLDQLLQQEDYAAACEVRDCIRSLELQARQLELEAAAAARAGVQHSIGNVIQHRRYGYRGVIFGYDAVCSAPEEWIQAMRVDLLPQGRRQPFYHVMVDVRDRPGAQTTYVAQENIVPVRSPREVQHPLVDSLFTRFSPREGGYVPGPRLREAYPADF